MGKSKKNFEIKMNLKHLFFNNSKHKNKNQSTDLLSFIKSENN
jgi:hypothetical protein